jgi:hypothetical protein
MTFKKIKILGKISLLSHHIMGNEKKGEKENILLFPQSPNPTREITL